MLQKKYWIGILLTLVLSPSSWAETAPKFLDTSTVPDFKESLSALKGKTTLPVIFPKKVPLLSGGPQYYVYVETQSHGSIYTISIDNTSACQGKHVCSLGSLTASIGDNPEIYYSMDNKELTVPVKLAGGKTGYFTPSHAMGDFWPPQIEWRDKNVLYRLSWNIAPKLPDKEMLINMVNSMY